MSRRRATDTIAVLLVVMFIAAVWAVPAGATTWSATFADHFNGQSYGGNDGDLDFKGPWAEEGDDGNPSTGLAQVYDDATCNGHCLRIGGQGIYIPYDLQVYRAVDLEGATYAELCFSWTRQQLVTGFGTVRIYVDVSNDGGSYWMELLNVRLNGDDGGVWTQDGGDITEYIGPNTLIRFRAQGGITIGSYLLIDNVEIHADYEGSGSTTTSTTTSTTIDATTTTIAPTTTSTTKPQGTTTTTTSPITTTRPSSTTTTTLATTTTAAPTTTTTATESASLTPPSVPPSQGDPAMPEPGSTEAFRSKMGFTSDLVMPGYMVAEMSAGLGGRSTATPLSGLAASFQATAETFRSNALESIVLGVLVAALLLIGVGRGPDLDETA